MSVYVKLPLIQPQSQEDVGDIFFEVGKENEMTLTLGKQTFELEYSKVNGKSLFAAVYSAGKTGEKIDIKNLIAKVSADLAKEIGELELDIIGLQLAFIRSPGATSSWLFSFRLKDIELSKNLPLVKTVLSNETLALKNLQFSAASGTFDAQIIQKINQITHQAQSGSYSLPDNVTNKLCLSSEIKIGEKSYNITLPPVVQPEEKGNGGEQKMTIAAAAPPSSKGRFSFSDGTAWLKIQKSLGPVYFDKVGGQYKTQTLTFMLDASLSLGGLTLSLDGLSVGSSIKQFSPEFNLHGLGINYEKGGLEIGGAFLHQKNQSTQEDEYDGMVVLKTELLSLSALGSYTKHDGHTSLFIYGVLGYPLGGPAFFFVTGLAAGFGYNRELLMPPIEQVASFPLITEATDPTPSPPTSQSDLTAQLDKLNQYIPASIGEMFLAVGIKFTSFKLIDSFALLTVAFGHHFEIDILGLSTFIVPTPEEGGEEVTPLAEVQLALKASFIPDEGFLGLMAQLTSASYILSKDCHLTGGYAFYSWFEGEHAGDFVNTLGGYHPKFKVPSYYPQVPRLGFNWKVDSSITLKGGVYYALCAHALMAGGYLDASYHSGSLRAWFKAGADFLIAWKPYHYDADIYVDLGASVGFISIDVGADIHIWGPEFGGTAHIHLFIISFSVSFGSSGATPQPIPWQTFKKSFLPADDKICSLSVSGGLIKTIETDNPAKKSHWIINPKTFSLVVNSVIPTKSATAAGSSLNIDQANTDFGIGSMALAATDLTTSQTISITRDKTPYEGDFAYYPILKKAPAGLWGKELTPQLNGDRFIDNTVAGFEIKPAKLPKPGETHDIYRKRLQYETQPIPDAYAWQTLTPFTSNGEAEPERRASINNITSSSVTATRNGLLTNLDFDTAEISLSASVADAFLIAPQVAVAGS